MRKIVVFLLLSVVISSCKNNPKQIEKEAEKEQPVETGNYVEIETPKETAPVLVEKIESHFEKPFDREFDLDSSLIVNEQCAIYLLPSDNEIEILKGDDPESFYVAADDNNYYMYQGRTLLESQKIKVFSTDKRYIVFEKGNEKEFVYDSNRDTGWALIFYYPYYEEPIIAEFILDSETVESYFGPLNWRVRNYADSLYPTDKFTINKKQFQFKSYTIDFIQLKEEEFSGKFWIPCRSWLYVMNESDTIDVKYYSSLEAVGGCAGLFLQEEQPLENYFIASKFGDYEGNLLLIDQNGKINQYPGGQYCLSLDEKHLFSPWDSDISGLTVIDIETGAAIFEKPLPFYFQNIYEFENEYYLFDSDAKPEKSKVYKFDFEKLEVLKVEIDGETLKNFNKIDYYNNVFDLEDCVCN